MPRQLVDFADGLEVSAQHRDLVVSAQIAGGDHLDQLRKRDLLEHLAIGALDA